MKTLHAEVKANLTDVLRMLVLSITGEPQEWRSQEITDVHLQKLENTRATEEWIRIARLLELDDQQITAIEKRHSTSDRECFRRMVGVWRDMDIEHTVGPLYDALVQAKLKGVAQRAFDIRPSQ